MQREQDDVLNKALKTQRELLDAERDFEVR